MCEWRQVTIGDLGRVVTGATPKAAETDSWGESLDFITPTDQRDGTREATPTRRLSELGAARLAKRLIPAGSSCFTCIGSTIGKVSRTSQPAVTNQQINSVISNPDVADGYFVYYLLRFKSDEITQIASGSATPIINRSHFSKYAVRVPSLNIQKDIGKVLGALDDKIVVNERISRESYELVQAFWAKESRQASDSTTFANLASLDKGVSYKSSGLGSGYPLVNLGNFGTDGCFKKDQLKYYSGEVRERHWVRDYDLVIANTDLTQRREILGQPTLVQTDAERALFTHHVFAVRPRSGSEDDLLWLYGALRDVAFRERAVTFASGTTVASLPRDAVLTYELPWPEENERRSWSERARALLDSAIRRTTENETLAQLRDTLLPKLMSGELRVRDAERVVEEAT